MPDDPGVSPPDYPTKDDGLLVLLLCVLLVAVVVDIIITVVLRYV